LNKLQKLPNYSKDPDQAVSLKAISVMRRMGDPLGDYTDILTEMLKSQNDIVRIRASQALGTAGKSASPQLPEIVELLINSNSKIRGTAASTLGRLGEHAKPALPRLEELLKDDNPVIRSSSIKALWKMGPNAGDQIGNIVVLLSDPDRDVRADAAYALGQIGSLNDDQVMQLASLLNDQDKKVRYKTLQAIGEIGTQANKYAPQVAELLNDPDELVSTSAAKALATVAPEDTSQAENIGLYIKELSNDQKTNRVKIVAGLETLAIMGNTAKEQGSTVSELLLGSNPIVRSNATNTVLQMAPLDRKTVLNVLASTYTHPYNSNEIRLLAHQIANGDEESEILISWLGKSDKKTASNKDIENSAKTLNVLIESWDFTKPHKEMREDLVIAISETIKSGNWTKDDLATLKLVSEGFKSNGYTEQSDQTSAKIKEIGE